MTKVDERLVRRRSDARVPAGHSEPSLRLQLGMWGTIAGFAAVLTLTVWLTWPGPQPDNSRAHAFRDVDLCVLTDSHGINTEPAMTTWANLQPVAADARIRLSYLSVTGPQTEDRAAEFVATLVQRGCDIIVAVGAAQAAGANRSNNANQSVHMLTVASDAEATNVAARVASLIPAA